MMDTLAYAKRLREAGIPQEQAEAHAEAAREFMTAEIATKSDILAAKTELLAVLKQEIANVKRDVASAQEVTSLKQDIGGLKQAVARLEQDVASLKQDVAGLKQGLARLEQDVADLKQDVMREIAAVEQRSRLALENLSLRLTVRLGILLAAGIAALGVIVRLGH